VSAERIRQIEANAIKKLRKLCRRRSLRSSEADTVGI